VPRAGRSANPYSRPDPKPTIVELLGLITPRQKSTYQSVSRSLKRLAGVHASLNYYGKEWGWALRYSRGDATLCTLHFLPSKLDATVAVSRKLEDWGLGPNHLSRATKRSLGSGRASNPARLIRMPLASPPRARDLVKMVRFKVQARPGLDRRRTGQPGKVAGARARTVTD
jgi:hypothetical protein